MLNPDYAEKISKKCYSSKEYKFPSGKIITIQGYEDLSLNYLINNENILENDIITSRTDVPECWYFDENKEKLRRYYVDIYIPSQNRCIEIKSTWTYVKKVNDNIYPKLNALKNLGYNCELWVYNVKKKIEKCEII